MHVQYRSDSEFHGFSRYTSIKYNTEWYGIFDKIKGFTIINDPYTVQQFIERENMLTEISFPEGDLIHKFKYYWAHSGYPESELNQMINIFTQGLIKVTKEEYYKLIN